MEFEVFLLFFLCSCLNGALGGSRIKQKRGVFQLAGAIECGTGSAAAFYLGYGCYCGIGGRGMPLDETDWCCYNHDCCYEYAEKFSCHPKLKKYRWECHNRSIKCDNTEDLCQKIMCECDKELAECLQKARYKWSHAMHPDFLCEKQTPQCKYYEADEDQSHSPQDQRRNGIFCFAIYNLCQSICLYKRSFSSRCLCHIRLASALVTIVALLIFVVGIFTFFFHLCTTDRCKEIFYRIGIVGEWTGFFGLTIYPVMYYTDFQRLSMLSREGVSIVLREKTQDPENPQ